MAIETANSVRRNCDIWSKLAENLRPSSKTALCLNLSFRLWDLQKNFSSKTLTLADLTLTTGLFSMFFVIFSQRKVQLD